METNKDLKKKEKIELKDMIYTIRDKQVMLDFDLAKLFGYETRRLNEQVKNNISKFEEGSVFKLSKDEKDSLRSKKSTANVNRNNKSRNLPNVFTMQGIEVLSTILRTENLHQIMNSIRNEFANQEQNSMLVLSKNTDDIKNFIYTIRGVQVMLDIDLSRLYQVDTGRINEAAKRNNKRFPPMFRFQLTREEYTNLKSQFAISSLEETQHGGRRRLPFVYTEQGVAMLSAVLNSDIAIQVSINIMQAFVEMRHFLVENSTLLDSNGITNLFMEIGKLQEQGNEQKSRIYEIEEKSNKQKARLDDMEIHLTDIDTKVDTLLNNFIDESKVKQWVFVDGQKFEADEAYIHIYQQAKQTIYVIDDYVSIKTLRHLKHKNSNVQVILFSDNKAGKEHLTSTEIDDFNTEYPYLCLYPTHKLAHDRLIVLDYGTENEIIYTCGASSKDAGNRFCTILRVYEPLTFHSVIHKLMST